MRRDTDRNRPRWARKTIRSRAEDRPATLYAAARRRPLQAAAEALDAERVDPLGPYETRYDVMRGYGIDRSIIQP